VVVRVGINVLQEILLLSKCLGTEVARELLLLQMVRFDVSLEGEFGGEALGALWLRTSVLTIG